jgi:hypothetical protein
MANLHTYVKNIRILAICSLGGVQRSFIPLPSCFKYSKEDGQRHMCFTLSVKIYTPCQQSYFITLQYHKECSHNVDNYKGHF